MTYKLKYFFLRIWHYIANHEQFVSLDLTQKAEPGMFIVYSNGPKYLYLGSNKFLQVLEKDVRRHNIRKTLYIHRDQLTRDEIMKRAKPKFTLEEGI